MDEEDAVGGIVDDVACDDCFHPLDGGDEVDDEPHSKHQRKSPKMHSRPRMEAAAVELGGDSDDGQEPWHQDPAIRSVQVSLLEPGSNCPRLPQEHLPCWEKNPTMH